MRFRNILGGIIQTLSIATVVAISTASGTVQADSDGPGSNLPSSDQVTAVALRSGSDGRA